MKDVDLGERSSGEVPETTIGAEAPTVPTAREYVYPLMVSAVLVAVVQIPYALGYAAPIASSRFNGFLTYERDFNSYMSYIRQSKEGQWLFHNQFTPEPHRPVFFNLGWLLAGKLAAVTGVSIEQAYRILGALMAVLWAVCMYRLCSYFFVSRLMRRLVFSMVILGGGFGWIAYIHEQWVRLPVVGSVVGRFAPTDMRVGPHPFFHILFSPHETSAIAFVLLTLCLFLKAERTGRLIDYVWAGLACACLGAMRPFDMLSVLAANVFYVVFMAVFKGQYSMSLAWRRLLVTLIPLPLLAYYVWLFAVHPIYRWWGIQNIMEPPPLGAFIFTLGFVAILFAFALDKLGGFQRKPIAQVLLASILPLRFRDCVRGEPVHQKFRPVAQPVRRLSLRCWRPSTSSLRSWH